MNREGLQRSAVLLLALGEETAAQVFRQLSPFEVAELGRAMREIGPLPRELVQSVIQDYEVEAAKQTGFGADADQFLDAALTRAVGDERARSLMTRIAGDTADLQKLAWKEPAEIAALLRDEHPQLVAVVLARLERSQAAATLEWLPQDMRSEVLRRLSEWQGAPPEALRELDAWLLHSLEKTPDAADGEALAADILGRLTPAARQQVEAGLLQQAPGLLQQIKAHQLELNDLMNLAGESRMRFFKAVPGRTLLLALKGADPELVEGLCAHMPGKAAQRLRDDLDALGAVRLDDIETAQAETVKLLREMTVQGQINLMQQETASDTAE